MMSSSVAEMEHRVEWLNAEVDQLKYESPKEWAAIKGRLDLEREVLNRLRHRVFYYLCRCEMRVTYGAASAYIFEAHRTKVDRHLAMLAPDILSEFNAAYRRAREGDEPSRSHALTSCRRILKAVADLVYPPSSDPVVGKDGKKRILTDDLYIARLWQFLGQEAERGTAAEVVLAAAEDLGKRLDRLYDLINKGVHAEVAEEEMDLCVIQTYLFVGEVLRLFDNRGSGPAAPPAA